MSVDAGLRALFRANLRQVDFVSVESSRTGRGVPDTNYCVAGCEGWIEFKRCVGWRVRVSAEQVAWAERRVAHGGRVLVVCRRPDSLWTFRGSDLRLLKVERLLEVAPLLVWQGRPASWPWDAMLAEMMAENKQ